MHPFATVEQRSQHVSQQAPWLPALSPCGKLPSDFSVTLRAREGTLQRQLDLISKPLDSWGKTPLEAIALHKGAGMSLSRDVEAG